MDILGTILIVGFVALLLTTALTFGFAIITACLLITAVTALLIVLRETWRRWKFLYTSRDEPPSMIDGEYRDISGDHREER